MSTSHVYKQAIRCPCTRFNHCTRFKRCARESVVDTLFANDYKEFVEILLTKDSFCQDLPEESAEFAGIKEGLHGQLLNRSQYF